MTMNLQMKEPYIYRPKQSPRNHPLTNIRKMCISSLPIYKSLKLRRSFHIFKPLINKSLPWFEITKNHNDIFLTKNHQTPWAKLVRWVDSKGIKGQVLYGLAYNLFSPNFLVMSYWMAQMTLEEKKSWQVA